MQRFKVILRDETTMTKTDQGIVLFSKKTGAFFGLNDIGFEMLRRLELADSETVAQELAGLCQVDVKQVTNDMNELVQGMLNNKLVEKLFCHDLV